MFSLYWVLFVIYVGLCAYNSQFFVHTFVIIIILIAFPFFINPLTDIVKIAMNDGLDYMNNFSISDPNIVKKGEDWAEDVQKNFYKSDSGKKIAKAFESGTDYASGYTGSSGSSGSKRDLEDLLNSLGTPPNIPTSIEIITQENKPTLQFIDRFGILSKGPGNNIFVVAEAPAVKKKVISKTDNDLNGIFLILIKNIENFNYIKKKTNETNKN